MSAKPHITLTRVSEPVTVRFNGVTVAKTDGAMELKEGTYAPVLYIPLADCVMEHLSRTEHSTHCPHKGDAVYWSLSAGGQISENTVWSYPTPIEGMEALSSLVAFYADRVEIERG